MIGRASFIAYFGCGTYRLLKAAQCRSWSKRRGLYDRCASHFAMQIRLAVSHRVTHRFFRASHLNRLREVFWLHVMWRPEQSRFLQVSQSGVESLGCAKADEHSEILNSTQADRTAMRALDIKTSVDEGHHRSLVTDGRLLIYLKRQDDKSRKLRTRNERGGARVWSQVCQMGGRRLRLV